MVNILVRPQERLIDVPPFALPAVRVPVPAPPFQRRMHVRVPAHQVLDEPAQLRHILIHIRLDLQDLLVQAVVAVAPVPPVDFPDGQAQIIFRKDLLVNSHSFHQG